jgi:t-SNARE complex subunit (syntaxin)
VSTEWWRAAVVSPLGQLVAADIAAARGAQREGSALAAVQEIQRRASELERLLRQT